MVLAKWIAVFCCLKQRVAHGFLNDCVETLRSMTFEEMRAVEKRVSLRMGNNATRKKRNIKRDKEANKFQMRDNRK